VESTRDIGWVVVGLIAAIFALCFWCSTVQNIREQYKHQVKVEQGLVVTNTNGWRPGVKGKPPGKPPKKRFAKPGNAP